MTRDMRFFLIGAGHATLAFVGGVIVGFTATPLQANLFVIAAIVASALAARYVTVPWARGGERDG